MTYVKIIRDDTVVISKALGSLENPYIVLWGVPIYLEYEDYEVVPMPKELAPPEPMEVGKTVTAITECDFKRVTLTFMRVDNEPNPWMSYYGGIGRWRSWDELEVIDVH